MEKFYAIFKPLLAWGPWGVFLLSVLDSAGIPVPEAVDFLIVVVANQDATLGYLSAALAVPGSIAGCMFLYYLGRKGGEAYLDRKTEKLRWTNNFRRWFQQYGLLTVFIPALVPAPLPLKIFVLSAGAFRIRPLEFLVVVIAARVPRYFGEAYLGAQLGDKPMHYIAGHKWQLAAFSVGLFLFLAALVKLKDRRRRAALQ